MDDKDRYDRQMTEFKVSGWAFKQNSTCADPLSPAQAKKAAEAELAAIASSSETNAKAT